MTGEAPGAFFYQAGSGTPLYEAVKQHIRAQIRSGAWPANHRVPSENELVTAMNISRMTANRALRELAAEGAIVRVHGVGSFVAPPKASSTLIDIRNIAEEILERGHRHRAEVVLLRREKASAQMEDRLELGPDRTLFHSLVVHYENDVPIQVENRYVNPAAAPQYLEQDFGQDTTANAYLSRIAPITEAEHRVEAVMPNKDECGYLNIPPSEPCLSLQRRTWSNGIPVTFVRLLYPGSRYRLEGWITGDGGDARK